MVCALIAARRGHDVKLIDAEDELGGKLLSASAARIKFDLDNYRSYLVRQVREQTEKPNGNLTLELGRAARAEDLAKAGFDAIVCATGTSNAIPPIPGLTELAASGHAVQATQLLRQPALLGTAKTVAIIGGGAVGCEVAQWLTVEHGIPQVSVIEMLPHMMQGACTANRGHLLHALRGRNVRLLNMTRVERAEVEGKRESGAPSRCARLHLSRNCHKNVPDPYVSWSPVLPENVENPLAPKIGNDWKSLELTCDLVIIACGGHPDDALFYKLQQTHAADEMHNIGDGFAPGRVLEAVRAAYRLGTNI